MADMLLLDIWVLARTVGAAMDDAVAPAGLVGREFVLYALLDALGVTTPTDLARRTGVPATTISKMLHRMHERGHLDEQEHPDDARSHLLRLTPEGRDVLAVAHEGFGALSRQVVDELGPETDQITWSLARLRAALGEVTGDAVETTATGERPAAATARAVRYVGRALSEEEQAQVADFIDFVRGRSRGGA